MVENDTRITIEGRDDIEDFGCCSDIYIDDENKLEDYKEKSE